MTSRQILPLIERLPTSWRLMKFIELLAEPVSNGVYKKKEFHGRGQKVINMGELFAYDFISDQEMRRVELDSRELGKSLVRDGDLLFARRSLVLEGSGKCSLVVCPSEDTTFESSIIRARLDPGRANPRFYYYYFRSPSGRGLMSSIATRTAVSGIRGSDLAQLGLPYPPLPIQRKIAGILSAYDDLIENNTRRIKILEDMARTLYREWFVEFRAPGVKLRKATPEEKNVTGKNVFPVGWKVINLGEVADVNVSSIGKGTEPLEINYVDIASVSTGQIDKIEPMAFADAPGRARRIVKHGDLIWSMVRPNRESYALILNPLPDLIVSTGFAVITAKHVPYAYLYHALTTDDFVGYLTNHATGSAYPAVNADDFRNAMIVFPLNSLLNSFHGVVVDLLDETRNLRQRNANLRRTRDLLLPRLVSGEVDVERMTVEG